MELHTLILCISKMEICAMVVVPSQGGAGLVARAYADLKKGIQLSCIFVTHVSGDGRTSMVSLHVLIRAAISQLEAEGCFIR